LEREHVVAKRFKQIFKRFAHSVIIVNHHNGTSLSVHLHSPQARTFYLVDSKRQIYEPSITAFCYVCGYYLRQTQFPCGSLITENMTFHIFSPQAKLPTNAGFFPTPKLPWVKVKMRAGFYLALKSGRIGLCGRSLSDSGISRPKERLLDYLHTYAPKRVFPTVICFLTLLVALPALVVAQSSQNQVSVAHVQVRVVMIPAIEDSNIQFRRILGAQGLSQTRVSTVIQDDLGFIWFATQYGLDRYDGYRFKVYKPERGKPNGPAGAYINSLFKDREGKLWLGTGRSLDRFDPVTEVFTHFHLDHSSSNNNVDYSVRSIAEDLDGFILGCDRKGLM
jgi:hypothetical protein